MAGTCPTKLNQRSPCPSCVTVKTKNDNDQATATKTKIDEASPKTQTDTILLGIWALSNTVWTATEMNTNLRYILEQQGKPLAVRGGSDNRGSTYLLVLHDPIKNSQWGCCF